MPFAKIKLCESTDVALSIFEMFKNNSVNFVQKEEYEDEDIVTKFAPQNDPKWVSLEGEPNPYDRTPYDTVAELLQSHRTELRVHDLEASGKWHNRIENRLVQVFLMDYRTLSKIIFSVTVSREYLDGEEVSGWTRWTMSRVEVKVCHKPTVYNSSGSMEMFKFRASGWSFRECENPSEEMKRNFFGFVYYDHPYYEHAS